MIEEYIKYYSSPLGLLKITSNSKAIKAISFVDKAEVSSQNIPEILNQCTKQLKEYFEGTRKNFDLNFEPEGTAFQHNVWKLVCKIPFGQTKSYLEIAINTGSEKNTRAVGLANGKNPIPIIIPCHRVIGSNGKLTGYAGGLERKRWLLLHEQNNSPDQNLLF